VKIHYVVELKHGGEWIPNHLCYTLTEAEKVVNDYPYVARYPYRTMPGNSPNIRVIMVHTVEEKHIVGEWEMKLRA
jgi:hypothetical protein